MKKVILADISLRDGGKNSNHVLSFREKVEMLKLLERTGVNAIEIPAIKNLKTDGLFLKMAASILDKSTLVCQMDLTTQGIDDAWHCLGEAKNLVLQIAVPTSVVQMEYFCHKKPQAVLEMTAELVKHAKGYCPNIEFVALDATRSNRDFLIQMLETALANGATQITVCDSAGMMMADEFGQFIDELYQAVPQLADVTLGAEIYNKLNMAEACAFTALTKGAQVLKTTIDSNEYPNLGCMVHLLSEKGDRYDLATDIKTTELTRSITKLSNLLQSQRTGRSPFDFGVADSKNDLTFDKNDDQTAISQAAIKLGYELSEEDNARVYEAFATIAAKKDFVSSRELEAIIASTALQVPAAYKIDNYVINSGNLINATAAVCLQKNGELLQGISLGDGPIDAAFLAIEQIVGHHYELDDFQIQSVTEGREAMGSALVKLRHNGKLYAGNGISTDIIGASIRAYVSALNKIAYEEESR